MGKDKWAKVIDYLRKSKRDPDKVLRLLKGGDKGTETSYTVARSSYSLNVIAVITQRTLDPKNKDLPLTQVIWNWIRTKDFENFYNLMKLNEKKTYDKNEQADYVKQIEDLWYSPKQKANREYFKKTKGYILVNPTTAPQEISKEIKNKSYHSSLLKIKTR